MAHSLSRRNVLRGAVFGAAAAGLPAVDLSAALASAELSPDFERMRSAGRLVVAIGGFETPPFFAEKDGELAGQDIAIAKQLGLALNLPVAFDRRAKTFNEVVDVVYNGDADIAISKLSRTYERTMRVGFSAPYLVLRHGIAFNRLRLAEFSRGRDIIDLIKTLDGEVAVLENSAFIDYAKHNFPAAKVTQMKSWPEIQDAVLTGRVLCAYRDELEIKRISRQNKSNALKLRNVTLTDVRDYIAMATRQESGGLRAFVDIFLEQMNLSLTADNILDANSELLK